MKILRVLPLPAALLLLTPLLPALDLPRKSPELTIQMNGSKPLQLSQYRGKSVVLAFILTSCPHCQQVVGCLSKDQPEFAPRGLQVLAAAVEDGADKLVPGFVHKFNPPFPVGYDLDRYGILDYLQHPRAVVPRMPILVFIDKDGIIRAQYEGNDPFLDEKTVEANLRKGIEDLLKGPAAPKPDPRKTTASPKKSGYR